MGFSQALLILDEDLHRAVNPDRKDGLNGGLVRGPVRSVNDSDWVQLMALIMSDFLQTGSKHQVLL